MFCVVTPYVFLDMYRRFGGIRCYPTHGIFLFQAVDDDSKSLRNVSLVLCDITQSIYVDRYICFRDTCCLHFDIKPCLLKMEAAGSFETLVSKQTRSYHAQQS